MPKKVLQIINAPYRCTIEEQDDPAIWITHAMRGAGGNFSVLLRGSAVNYAKRDQDAAGLCIGGKEQTQPPRIDRDVASLMEKGVAVYVVENDVVERGLERRELLEGIQFTSRQNVSQLFDTHDAIWHW